MRGVFFQKPFELSLRVEGESWQQGDAVSGVLVVKNQGAVAVATSGIRVQLAYGELKKVRLKSKGALKELGSVLLEGTPTLEPQKEAALAWKFQLDRNSPITDGSGSLFLAYGRSEAAELENLGLLQLVVQPYWVIREILETLATQFKFLTRTQKSNKGSVEVKLVPPDTKNFATLEHVIATFRFNEEVLECQFTFHIKTVEAASAAIEMKKDKKIAKARFTPDRYRTSSGRYHHESMEAGLREILSAVNSVNWV